MNSNLLSSASYTLHTFFSLSNLHFPQTHSTSPTQPPFKPLYTHKPPSPNSTPQAGSWQPVVLTVLLEYGIWIPKVPCGGSRAMSKRSLASSACDSGFALVSLALTNIYAFVLFNWGLFSWSRNSRYVLTSSKDWNVVVWDLASETDPPRRVVTVRFDAPIASASFHPRNRCVLLFDSTMDSTYSLNF